MKKLLSAQLAGHILLTAMAVLMIFHLLILFRFIPTDFVWGGQVGEGSLDLIIMELTAMLLTLLFGIIIGIKAHYLKSGKNKLSITIALWVIFGYFILNTIGNLTSAVSLETYIFTPFTLIVALLLYRLAIEK